MKKFNKLGQLALLAVLAVALSITACKQASSGSNADGTSGGETGTKTFTGNGVSFNMNKIPAVTDGIIGSDDRDNNKPHQVSLSEYYLGETEVTQ